MRGEYDLTRVEKEVSTSRTVHRLGLLLPLLPLCHSTLRAQGWAAWSRRGMDSLATWNCAQYYSGTVSISSELKGPDINQARSNRSGSGHVPVRGSQDRA